MKQQRKPIEIIADELSLEVDYPDDVAEDVIAALEDEGWRFVSVPDGSGTQP